MAVAACGSSSSTGQASPSGAVQATTAKNFHVSTPNGDVSLSLDGLLPPGWPSDFPTPPGSMAAGSGSLSGSSKGVMVGVYTTSTTAPQAFTFYGSGAGLTTTSGSGVGAGQSYVGRMKITAPYTGSVTTLSRGGQTYIVAVLTSAGPSPSPSPSK